MSQDLKNIMLGLGREARKAAQVLALASGTEKNEALLAMAQGLKDHEQAIIASNLEDVQAAREKGLSDAMIDRLVLNPDRIGAMADSLKSIAKMDDPVGLIQDQWKRPNGLGFSKVSIPIGVIGMIYESRPNVTSDAGALCLKSGNACILRGGSESLRSNQAIYNALQDGLASTDLPVSAIQLVPTTDRAAVGELLSGLDGNVDMIIPRGGKSLIARVQSDARVPVLAHLEGLCHTYVHESADLGKAQQIVLNAKLRRTGVCGSTETLLVDHSIKNQFLPPMIETLVNAGCEVRGDKETQTLRPENVSLATEDDYFTEHLAPIINVRAVNGLDAAIAHINHYGSGHTDAIITEDQTAADYFHRAVDSAIVIHNASTQFADGGEFGFGAEIGISTGRLHARGPVGAQHLTTFKYLVHGQGQVRPK